MFLNKCKICGVAFEADAAWKTKCKPCFIQEKRAEREAIEKEERSFERELRRDATIAEMIKEAERKGYTQGYREGYNEGRNCKEAYAESVVNPSKREFVLPAEIYKKLIFLTHPDIHRESPKRLEIANEITVWINTHRDR